MNSPAAAREYALLALLLTAALLLAALFPDAGGLRRGVLAGAAPLLALPRHALAWLGADAAGRAAARQSTAELRADNTRLQQRVIELEQESRAAATLRAQQNMPPAPAFVMQRTLVIGADAQPWPMELLLDCGQRTGAVPLQGVAAVSDGRLVCLGRLSSVAATAARFQPLLHSACKLPAQLADGRRGLVLAGAGTSYCRLDYAPPELAIRVGDEILTAGDGDYLPAGLLLGHVIRVVAGSGPFQDILVAPALDPYRCDAVFLLPAPAAENRP